MDSERIHLEQGKLSAGEYPCPCCGFLVFGDPPGSYDICPICSWEDDHVQLAFPIMTGGANRESLADAQAAALVKVPGDLRTYGAFVRDPGWRPLVASELGDVADSSADSKRNADDAPVYYWRR